MKEKISVLPAGRDNYTYLIEGDDALLVVDPSDAAQVISFAEKVQKPVDMILNTHHHADHCSGNSPLFKRYKCQIGGAGKDSNAALNIVFEGGDFFEFGDFKLTVFMTPGHSKSSICFLAESKQERSYLFSGDTLFSMGCGRIFDGTSEELYNSLLKIRELPDETSLFPGHEYALDNIAYSIHINFSKDYMLKSRDLLLKKSAAGELLVPVRLGDEKKYNPFLNCDRDDLWKDNDSFFRKTPLERFIKLREDKNNF